MTSQRLLARPRIASMSTRVSFSRWLLGARVVDMSATGCGVCPRWDAPSVYDQNDISESADLALLVNPSEIRIDPRGCFCLEAAADS